MSVDPTAIAMTLDPTQQRMVGTARHGNTPFDVPFISQIDATFWQGGCANGLVLPTFIEHVVSLYPWEAYTVAHSLGSMLAVQMYDDLEGPDASWVLEIAQWVNACRAKGPTLLHCQAGLNRSSLVAARALMLDGHSADGAIELLREKRSPAVLCNPNFEQWLRGLGGHVDEH